MTPRSALLTDDDRDVLDVPAAIDDSALREKVEILHRGAQRQVRRLPIPFAGSSTMETILSDQVPFWVRPILPDILEFEALGDGWDSYGGLAPSAWFLNSVVQVLCRAKDVEGVPVPQVVPMSGGGIQFEWILPESESEMSFLPDGSVTYLKTTPDGKVLEELFFSIENGGLLRRALRIIKSGN